MDKYTHIEILKVFTNFSYCFILLYFNYNILKLPKICYLLKLD
nr:MAG TPA: hypothetical protein [Caudoviricetes sp.]